MDTWADPGSSSGSLFARHILDLALSGWTARLEQKINTRTGSGTASPVNVVKAVLDSIISSTVSAEIRSPDEHGAFPSANWPVHWFPVPPLVIDANVLRNDILYSCRMQQRTTLVTAANARVLRLFCASHVPEEVEEHAAEWAAEGKVDVDELLRRWRSEYVPLLRRVEVPYELLTDDEYNAWSS